MKDSPNMKIGPAPDIRQSSAEKTLTPITSTKTELKQPYHGIHGISVSMYHNYKRRLQKLEAKNHNRIYIIPCSGKGKWFELAEHSALFYYHEIVMLFGLSTKFIEDALSQYDRYTYGSIHNCNLPDIRKRLIEAGIYQSEGYTNRVFYFELNKTFTDTKISDIWKNEQQRRIRNNSIQPVNNVVPELFTIICLLGRNFHQICNSKMNQASRATLGQDILLTINEISVLYHQIAYLHKTPSYTLAKWGMLRTKFYNLRIYLKVTSDFGVWQRDNIICYVDNINRAIELVEKNIAKLTKKHNKEENNE